MTNEMPKTHDLKKAFADFGMRAYYNGEPARVLALSPAVYAKMLDGELAKTGQTVSEGQMIVTAAGKGTVLNMGARNDLQFVIPRKDGSEEIVRGGYGNTDRLADAHAILALQRDAKRDAKNVARENERLAKEFAAAIQRGETVEEPEYRQNKFADDAFDKANTFVEAVETYLAQNTVHGYDAESVTQSGTAIERLRRSMKNVLDDEDLAKAKEARELRQRIGELNTDHEKALPPKAAVYEAEDAGQAARDAVESLDLGGEGFSARQMAMLSSNTVLSKEVFGVLTTTPIQAVTARMLSRVDFETAEQELGRFEEMDWSTKAVAGIREVLKERMPGYDFRAKIYEIEGADVMLVQDPVGSYLYSWDSASRVAEINVKDQILYTFTEKDVPSDAELEDLRRIAHDLSFDATEEITFG